MKRPFLAITLGDPAGCGPWVGVRAALDRRVLRRARPLLVGDAGVVRRFVRFPRLRVLPLTQFSDHKEVPDVVAVWHVPHPHMDRLVLGKPQRVGGESAVMAVRAAVDLLRAGNVAALVTGPVSKESFKAAGLPHPGHTEMLASLAGSGFVDMVMMADSLRTLLVTRHLPLRALGRALTRQKIVDSVTRTDRWVRVTMGFRRPSWVICGLNPHAGDRGLLGTEEQRVIAPAVAFLRRRGVRIDGPLPADTAWAKHRAGDYDWVASLYHDQGMIPLKVTAPREVVNVTVGLPFVRTSPGHGTAFDLAKGRPPYGRVDAEPTVQACLVALAMAARRRS